MNKSLVLSLLGLVIFGLLIRVVKLDQLPAILNRDEAALAYNALLLKSVGLDEWQRPWPLALESFGDYKLPGYVYSLVLLFSFLPTQDWVVRLPATMAGVSLAPLVYWLAGRLGLSKKKALLAAFLIAVTPVYFFYSRMAFEALLALPISLLGFGLLLHEKKGVAGIMQDLLAAGLFLIAVLTYNTPLLLLPLYTVLVLIRRVSTSFTSRAGTALLFGTLFIAVWVVLSPVSSQKKGITLFSDESTLTKSIEFRQALPQPLQPVLGSKYLYYAGQTAKNYLASIGPTFLVTAGGSHPWHALPGFGHLGWTVYALGWVGVVAALVSVVRHPRKSLTSPEFALLWLAASSLLPSVVTVDSPHATRSLVFFIWWTLFAVEGSVVLSTFLTKVAKKYTSLRQLGRRATAIICILAVLEFSWYLANYYTQYPFRQPPELDVGFDQAVRAVTAKYPHEQIAVVDGDGFNYILAAWYLKLEPSQYFSTVVRQQPNSIGFRYGEQLVNLHFIAQSSDRSKTGEKVLLSNETGTWEVKTW